MKIGIIASHSALSIISGAKVEGFDTELYCIIAAVKEDNLSEVST